MEYSCNINKEMVLRKSFGEKAMSKSSYEIKGKGLKIDLSTGKITQFEIEEREILHYLGGKGLGSYYLLKESPQFIDPLGEENPLIITTGVLTGSVSPCSARFNASAKSPLTEAIGSSNCGGDFGVQLKKAGYDALIIKGKADSPVYIEISDDKVEIKSAKELWGKDTKTVQNYFGEKWGKLVIGPAGENLVRFANIMSGHRTLGRTGMGAVMGSKKLKAIIARGSKEIQIAERERFKDIIKRWTWIETSHPIPGKQLPLYGTSGLVNITNMTFTLPVRNFKYGYHPEAYKISGEYMAETILKKNVGCKYCPIRCGRWVEIEGEERKGPEYETIGLLGSNLENFDLKKVTELAELCDKLGLDTISTGGVIGFAMELTENGKIKSELRFGKNDNLGKTIEEIAYRRELGDELAEGSMRLSLKYGGKEYAIHVKGLELAAYEPRRSVGLGLGYAVSNRGGCHLNAGYLVFFEAVGPIQIDPLTPFGKPQLTIFQQNIFEAVSASGTCLFTTYAVIPGGIEKLISPHGPISLVLSKLLLTLGFTLSIQKRMPYKLLKFDLPTLPHVPAISAALGKEYHFGDFLKTGERIYNLERMYNLREGVTYYEDTLPERLKDIPQDPSNPKTKVPLSKMLKKYYEVRGWDKNGIPFPSTLKKLDLEWLLPLLEEITKMSPQYYYNKRLELIKKHSKLFQ